MFYFYDATYILVLIGAALSMWASANVNSAIQKYRRVESNSGMTAADVARRILQQHGIFDVNVKPISQGASDYYNPSTKEVCLLTQNYNSSSIASTAPDEPKIRSHIVSVSPPPFAASPCCITKP